MVEKPARRSKLTTVLRKAAMILGPLSAWTVLLSSPNVTSLTSWKQFSMVQCPRFSLSKRSGMAIVAGQKHLAKCCFYLFYIQPPKEALDRALMGGHTVLKSSRLFHLFALSCPPLGYCQFREMIGKHRGQC